MYDSQTSTEKMTPGWSSRGTVENTYYYKDNSKIFHPITNTVLNLETFTPLTNAKMPPQDLLQEYHQLITKHKKNIYKDEMGVYRLKDSDIYFKDGDWRSGTAKLLGFPAP